MMHWMFGNYGMGFGPGMGIFMFLFWFLIILGIVLLVRAVLGAGRKGDGTETGKESAEEEFKRMRDNLR